MTKNRIYKIRFHLGAGENFMKWRVENVETKKVDFFDPDIYSLALNNCKLYNHKGTAEKIYDGANKTVCSWIMSSRVDILIGDPNDDKPNNKRLFYNPRVAPNWMDSDNKNIDKKEFNSLTTIGKKLFVNEY